MWSSVNLQCAHTITFFPYFVVTNRYYCLRPSRLFMQTTHDENHATFERESRLSFPHTFRSSASPDDLPVYYFSFFIFRCLQLKVYARWSSLIRTYRWTCTLNGRQNTKRPGKNVIILNIKRDLHCTLLSCCIETKPFRIAGEVLLDFKKTGFIGF